MNAVPTLDKNVNYDVNSVVLHHHYYNKLLVLPIVTGITGQISKHTKIKSMLSKTHFRFFL